MADVGPNSRRKRSESVRQPAPFITIATLSKVGAEPSDSGCDVLLPCLDERLPCPGFEQDARRISADRDRQRLTRRLTRDRSRPWRHSRSDRTSRYGAACHAGAPRRNRRPSCGHGCRRQPGPPPASGTGCTPTSATKPTSLWAPAGWFTAAHKLLAAAPRQRRGRSSAATPDWAFRAMLDQCGRPPRSAARSRPAGSTVGISGRNRRTRAADAGWRVVAVDVDYLERRGNSKVTGTPIGAWRAVRDVTAAMALRSR